VEGNIQKAGIYEVVATGPGGDTTQVAYVEYSPTTFETWIAQRGIPVEWQARDLDYDHDGWSNWQEYRNLTDPTDPNAYLRLFPQLTADTPLLTWPSVNGRLYWMETSPDLQTWTRQEPVMGWEKQRRDFRWRAVPGRWWWGAPQGGDAP